MPWVCLLFVIVIFPDHTHLLFFYLVCTLVFRLPNFGKFDWFYATMTTSTVQEVFGKHDSPMLLSQLTGLKTYV